MPPVPDAPKPAGFMADMTPAFFRKLFSALGIGLIGGAIAHSIDMPLAWMMGPMLATFIASLLRVKMGIPMRVRSVILGVIGIFLGASFTPETLDQASRWPLSMIAVLIYVPVITLIVTWFYTKIAKLDPATALFSATPGGLTPMVVLGAAAGGNEQEIALTQGLRVLLLVMSAPLIALLVTGVVATGHGDDAALSMDLTGGAITVALALVTVWLFRRIGVPAAEMTGAMMASMVLHVSGLVEGNLPGWLLAGSLWILGSAIGSRFAGIKLAFLIRLGGYAVLATAVVLAFTGLVSWGVSQALDLDFIAVLLAFAPGGVAEMSLIALALNVEPSFVAFHHIIRIFEIVLLAPIMAKWMQKRQMRNGA
ncbi:AbrB family transcriptional regulator [Thalassospira sp.]|uniref:AbrB family transcriptional regulator n=1 Tax=Thalassospira sp. TaxID=1912094 RepID=UPI002736968E|nr:AbrB family transcriptional regulator [Thalassospira sp.]MDP2698430.1 AbrB family transcriptional regulator [Thalassospira sp.]